MRKHVSLMAVILFGAHLVASNEPESRIRFQPTATSFETLTGMVVSQHIADADEFSPGAILVRLPDVDVSTLRGGVLLGRLQDGSHIEWLMADEYALGLLSVGAPEVAILPFKGWERGTKYAVRLQGTVRSTAGVPYPQSTWLVSIDGRTPLAQAAPPPAGDDPVKSIRFSADERFIRTAEGRVISQPVVDGDPMQAGVIYVTLTGDISQETIAGSIDLGRFVDGEAVWLQPRDYAVGLVGFKAGETQISMFPFKGWKPGGEYVFRFRDTATDLAGNPIADDGAAWVVGIPKRRPTPATAPGEAKQVLAASSPSSRFPGGQNLLFQGAWTDPNTGLAYHRGRWYDPRNGVFLSEDPKGAIDSENLYAFGRSAPQQYTDPLGLTSRTDVKLGRMYYTWNFGWVDTKHAYNDYPGLGPVWKALQNASPGQVIPFSLEMHQKEPGSLLYKQTKMDFTITAAQDEGQRKQQLLFAFQHLSEDFERYQGQGLQGSQLVTSIWGMLVSGEEEKIASSFSTEDLFSNLLAFHSTVESTTIEELVSRYGGTIDDEESAEFSLLVWDYLLKPKEEGQTEWAPLYLDPENLPTADEVVQDIMMYTPRAAPAEYAAQKALREIAERELTRFQELLTKYREKYGQPTLPQFLQLEPLAEGVEIVNVEHN